MNNAKTNTCQEDGQHMARDFYSVTRQTILKKYSEAKADRYPEMAIDEELFTKHAKTMKRYR